MEMKASGMTRTQKQEAIECAHQEMERAWSRCVKAHDRGEDELVVERLYEVYVRKNERWNDLQGDEVAGA